jgi:ribosome-associated heat shock protein Hsp15
MEKMRIDKWVWSVRIFKSRTLAADSAKSGKIKLNGNNAKPASVIGVGDKIEVKKNGFNFEFLVTALLKSRVGAPLAPLHYTDVTPEEEKNKFKSWFSARAKIEFRDPGTGRPTKRDRREIDDFKDETFSFDWYDDEGDLS